MNQTQHDRLSILADHLESGALFRDYFDFAVFHKIHDGCKTSGCAAGECVFLWPTDWQWNHDYEINGSHFPRLTKLVDSGVSSGCTRISLMEFFGLSDNEAGSLFYPNAGGRPWSTSERELGEEATKYDVASNIRNFLAWKDKTSITIKEVTERD